MSRVLDNFPEPNNAPKSLGGWKYPWSLWLDGRVHAITQGVEFFTTPSQLAQAAHAAARHRGRKVRTHWDAERLELVVQLI